MNRQIFVPKMSLCSIWWVDGFNKSTEKNVLHFVVYTGICESKKTKTQ